MVKYSFASGNLLEKPNNYSYTLFEDLAFLVAWREQRESIFHHPVLDKNTMLSMQPTDLLIDQLFNSFSTNTQEENDINTLNRLVQRFEVSKRLHSEYNSQWRPVDTENYHSLERYIKFANLLTLAYQTTFFLPYLNCFLKCMDTLCTLTPLMDALQFHTFKELLQKEKYFVAQLANKLGVTL